jgi:hypothetical protein
MFFCIACDGIRERAANQFAGSALSHAQDIVGSYPTKGTEEVD